MERSLLEMSALDTQIEQEISKHGRLKDFRVVLWRQEADTTGCNWNARIERTPGSKSADVNWWDVVPKLRERFNLA